MKLKRGMVEHAPNGSMLWDNQHMHILAYYVAGENKVYHRMLTFPAYTRRIQAYLQTLPSSAVHSSDKSGWKQVSK